MVFAVFALVMVGLSWSLTGIVMSDAPRKKCDPALLLMASGVVSCAISLTLCLSLQKELLPWKVILLTGGCYFLAAVINYCMLQIMAHVMQKGPNGVIWSIIQSGLVFPFLAGVIFYDSTLTWGRISGLSLILFSLACLGLGKENKEKEKGWKLLTLLCFLLAGLIQTLNSLPSYYPQARMINSMGRTCFSAAGTLFAAFCVCFFRYRHCPLGEILAELKRPLLWKYVLSLQAFSLICSYLLLYPGLDAMAKAGAGSISYPLVVGACIVGFNLYSLFFLKEKWNVLQAAGVAFCIGGGVLLV